jgi:hypothetical protein
MTKQREPMGLYVALSAAQLEWIGIPEWMPQDVVEECLDQALLTDTTAFQTEIHQWIEDHDERVLELKAEAINARFKR